MEAVFFGSLCRPSSWPFRLPPREQALAFGVTRVIRHGGTGILEMLSGVGPKEGWGARGSLLQKTGVSTPLPPAACSEHTAPGGSLLRFPLSPQGDPASCCCLSLQSAPVAVDGRPETLPTSPDGRLAFRVAWDGAHPSQHHLSQETVKSSLWPPLSVSSAANITRAKVLGQRHGSRAGLPCASEGSLCPPSAAPASPGGCTPRLSSWKRQRGWGFRDKIPGPRPVLAPGQRATSLQIPAQPSSS